MGHEPLARGGVEFSGGVPHGCALLGGFVALAFGGVQMQQLGAFHIFELAQQAHDFGHVVPVERSEIAYVHALENVLLMTDGRFDGVVEPQNALAPVIVEIASCAEPLRGFKAQTIVCCGGIEVEQVFFHASHGAIDAHIVIVEHDEQIVRRRRDVIQPLEGQTAAHRSVADDGHHMAVFVAGFLGRNGHAERGRDGIGGVAAGKGIVLALAGRRERPHAVQFAVGVKGVAPAGENFVPVGLVAHIPHQAVVGRVENIVQRHGEFYHAERRGKMARVHRNFLDDVAPQLAADLRQLFHGEPTQVGGAVYVA